ncbi:MAG: hypothetical protein R3F11_15855 [Verrucomicrobiales bacterium]
MLAVGAGTLEAGGDYRIQSWDGSAYGVSGGLLRMQDPAGRVVVGGDFTTDSANNHGGSSTAVRSNCAARSPGSPTTPPKTPALGSTSMPPAPPRGPDRYRRPIDPLRRSRKQHLCHPRGLTANQAVTLFESRAVITALFNHHGRPLQLATAAIDTDFPDSDSDTVRDHLDTFAGTYPYETWAALMFWNGDPDFALKTAPNADPDLDGIANALEYLMAMIPTYSDPRQHSVSTAMVGGAPHLALTFPHVKAADGSVSFGVVQSNALAPGSWSPLPSGAFESGCRQVKSNCSAPSIQRRSRLGKGDSFPSSRRVVEKSSAPGTNPQSQVPHTLSMVNPSWIRGIGCFHSTAVNGTIPSLWFNRSDRIPFDFIKKLIQISGGVCFTWTKPPPCSAPFQRVVLLFHKTLQNRPFRFQAIRSSGVERSLKNSVSQRLAVKFNSHAIPFLK